MATPTLPYMSNIGAVGIRLETTAGVEAAPSFPADFVLAQNVQYAPQGETVERNFLRPSFSRPLQRTARRSATVSFDVELMGTGVAASAGTPAAATPKWADLLEACAMSATNVASGDIGRVYTPTTNNQKTATIFLHLNGQLHKLTGAVGTFTINLPASGIGTISFTFTGTFIVPTAVADPAIPTQTVVPPVLENTGFVYNSVADLMVDSVSFDMGNAVVQRTSMTVPNGIHSFIITSRQPTFSMTTERVLENQVPFFGDFRDSTTRSCEFRVGSVNGNSIEFNLPTLQIQVPELGERDGIMTLTLPHNVSSASTNGNDEISIRFF